MTTFGALEFGFLNEQGHFITNPLNLPAVDAFQMRFAGSQTFGFEEYAAISVTGVATFTITVPELSTAESKVKMELDMSGKLSLEGLIEADAVVAAAGKFVVEVGFETSDETLGDTNVAVPIPVIDVWGVLNVDLDSKQLPFVESAGLVVEGDVLFMFNNTDEVKTPTLSLPNRVPETFEIAKSSMSFVVSGMLGFEGPWNSLGAPVDLKMAGTFGFEITTNFGLIKAGEELDRLDYGVTLFVLGSVELDAVGVNLINFDVGGVLSYGWDLGLSLSPPEPQINVDIAGAFFLRSRVGNDMLGSEITVNMLMNVTGEEVRYAIPERAVLPGLDLVELEAESGFLHPQPDGSVLAIIPPTPDATACTKDDPLECGYFQLAATVDINVLDVLAITGDVELQVNAVKGFYDGVGGPYVAIRTGSALIIGGI